MVGRVPRAAAPPGAKVADAQSGSTRAEDLPVLFHITQSHEPHDCPYGKGGSTSLFDSESKDVTILGYWLSFPKHTTYLVVETDDITHLHSFLLPGARVTTCDITPVSDQPVPPPA
jgi:hypothetical protein